MSSIQNFLQNALSIDTNESNAQQQYDFEKENQTLTYEGLTEAAKEQAQQLLDTGLQQLPFGIAEAARGVSNLWSTGKKIYAFKEKYSPEIAKFQSKVEDAFSNIGKDSESSVDFASVLKAGASKYGEAVIAKIAPQIKERTGIDIKVALEKSKGEGGIEAGIANLKEQGVNVGKKVATGLTNEVTTRVNEVASKANQLVNGAGVENAANPNLRIETSREIKNPIFEGLPSDEALAPHSNAFTQLIGSKADEASKAVAAKTQSVLDTFKKTKSDLITEFNNKKASLDTATDEATQRLSDAQAKVERLQAKAPAEQATGGRSMFPAERGRTPVTKTGSPQLEAAKQEVATHQATIDDLTNQTQGLIDEYQGKASAIKTSVASSLEGLQTEAKSIASQAFSAGKAVGGVALEGLGVAGGVESIIDLAQNKPTSGGQIFQDTAGIYAGGRSGQSLAGGAINFVKSKTQQAVNEASKVVEGETKNVAEYTAKFGEAGTQAVAKEAGAATAEATAEAVGKGLGEEGAELGATALGVSAIPIVGEVLDIGLGIGTLVDSLYNIFHKSSSAPAPPPPPPMPQQQVVSVQRQQGIF